MFRKLLISAAACAMFAATCSAQMQEQSGGQEQQLSQDQNQLLVQPPQDLDSMITMVRANMQADRASLVASAMNLNTKEAGPFWRIYEDYEHERSRIDDGRVAVIKEYTQSYFALTDSEARDMAEKMIGYDSRIAALKKKYYKRFNRELPAYTVTKFFQVDHRLDLIMDMKVEWSLPPLTAAAYSKQK